jgi:hypothetical protein
MISYLLNAPTLSGSLISLRKSTDRSPGLIRLLRLAVLSRQWTRMCFTVLVPVLHRYLAELKLGTFIRLRKWAKPITPVRAWISITLSAF